MSAWAAVSLPVRRRTLPRRGCVEVWLTDLDELPLDAGPDGSSRRERLGRRRLQQQFVLRLLLGSYLGCPGKDLNIARSSRGKPYLEAAPSAAPVTFNVSHSGSWLAIAIARELPVGIDIECERPMRRPIDMARRYFSASEAELIASLAEPGRSARFLRQWTAREAMVKASDSSLAESLAAIELDGESVAIRRLPPDWPSTEQWSLLAPDLPGGLRGHLAVPQPGIVVDRYFLQTAQRRAS
jgi:4'-phosphopantetheinyl transferase